MGTAADSLIEKYPTRTAQLKSPVYDYLLREAKSKRGAFTPDPQDLYMAVFNPASRKLPPGSVFSNRIRRDNPGIVTIQDYVNHVNSIKLTTWKLAPEEEQALQETARKLGVKRDSLYRLIGLESGWDPKAKNKISGARGLIQFMPSTATSMGFAAKAGLTGILIVAGILYLLLKQKATGY